MNDAQQKVSSKLIIYIMEQCENVVKMNIRNSESNTGK